MTAIIETHRDAIADLCRRFRVQRLEIFGSAGSNGFDPRTSDVDFLVEFLPEQDLGPWMSHYFELQRELEKLLGCQVDLVMSEAVTNPYFIREVNRTRRLLYAA